MRGLRRYFLNDLKPGMVLARTVFSDDDRNVISEGTVLTAQLIALLHSWAIPEVYILDTTGQAKNEQGFPKYAHTFKAILPILSDIFEKARLLKTLSADEIDELMEKTEDIIMSETGVLGYLAMIHNTDEYTFRHSADVGIVAGLIGKWMGYSEGQLQNLIMAGFLHDIGKTQIPLRILKKPGKLNADEWRAIRQHPILGFQLLQSSAPPPQEVLSVVLQHHERIDGSGYPHGLPGERIAVAAKIIAIADIYDAMISDRSYRPAETPFHAVEEIRRQMFGKLDPALCHHFITKAREFLIGVGVWLSDGSEATVIAMDQTAFSKPVVRTKTGFYINLVQSDLTIIGVEPYMKNFG